MKAVYALDWNKECTFDENTRVYLNQDEFSDWFDGMDHIQELKGKIVLDNTPLPIGGAVSDVSLTTMMTLRTEFNMQYNIKHLTIYCGLVCTLLLFIILGQIYLYCKLRRDTNSKRSKLAEEYSDNNSDYSAYKKLLPKTE